VGGQLDGRDAHRVHEVGVAQQVADERLGWLAGEVVVVALDVDAGSRLREEGYALQILSRVWDFVGEEAAG